MGFSITVITLVLFGCLGLLGIVIAGVVSIAGNAVDGPSRDASGAITAKQTIRVTDLRAGDCLADSDDESSRDVEVLPCTSPHTSEVFATYTLPEVSWVDVLKETEEASAGCRTRFQAYAGKKLDADLHHVYGWAPNARDRAEDRDVICLADSRAGPTTGSLRR